MVSYLRTRLGRVVALCILSPLFCGAQQASPGSAGDQASGFITFQAPDSTGTYPQSINDLMVVTGYYTPKFGGSRGFVRYADGAITTFAVPGAEWTSPVSINHAGDITGYYRLPYPPETASSSLSSVPQGFVRAADGTITTFGNTANGLGAGDISVRPIGINDAGEVVGTENDGSGQVMFMRSASGSVEKFSLGFSASDNIAVSGLNASGAVVGFTTVNPTAFEPQSHQGFLWAGNGSPTSIIAFGSSWTEPLAINSGGTIVGCYLSRSGILNFVRDPEGNFTTPYIPGALHPLCNLTINDAGTIMGSYYTNPTDVSIGFIKPRDGEVTTFAYPGASDTFPNGLNNLDAVTGWYVTSYGPEVGFIFVPGNSEHVE